MTGPASPRRIALVTSLLGGGGAERMMLTMAEWWVKQGAVVCVFVLREDGAVPEYPIPAGVQVQRLRLIRAHNPLLSGGHVRRLWALRRALLVWRPHVVISFQDKLNVTVLLALTGSAVPVVATEHLVPWRNPLGRGWEGLRRLVYRRAAGVVSPTQAMTEWFQAHVSGRHLTLPCPAQVRPGGPEMAKRSPVVMAAGRLTAVKGFDLLIGAWGQALKNRPDWSLQIAGEGEERDALERQIATLGLTRQVTLLGAVPDLPERLKSCALFALSSRHEAYSMVLCEALAAGCAVVAADCPTGPREILGEPAAGLLVAADDSAALAAGLERLISDGALRVQLSDLALRRAASLTAEAVMPAWDALVASVARA